MRITVDQTDDSTMLRLEGRLDASTSNDVGKSLQATLQQGVSRLLLDMTEVAYVSSAGLRVILMAAKTSKASAAGFAIFGLQSAVREVFDVSGFSKILVIEDDFATARARL